jgi:DNA-binding response OmpR family regulator
LLKRQSKTDNATPKGPPRILVVDDNPDAARLLGKLFRRVGYEVAEVSDHQVALITMMNEPAPISAVIASFSTSGNGSCLKLLDAVRHTPEARVNTQRMILILDTARQQMFSWQSGADEIILRPYRAEDMLAAVADAIDRPEAERAAYRRQMIDLIREHSTGPAEPVEPIVGAAHFN